MSAGGRLKRATRASIALCGGIDGARATVDRVGRTQVGNWNNLNHPDLPMLHDALALDEIAIAEGRVPPILAGYASELGHVAIRLPDPDMGTDAVTGAMIAATAEFGEVAVRLRDAVADSDFKPMERDEVAREIDEAQAALARLKALVLAQDDACSQRPRSGDD
ncbi:phage regulatory CII family protein [Alteriqipengyuania sp.]|uniref:phage regulatory CII family protein n=1 Tax=Alteriqipengyuania sp. TaxID=2800692 RepID=UPI003514FB17